MSWVHGCGVHGAAGETRHRCVGRISGTTPAWHEADCVREPDDTALIPDRMFAWDFVREIRVQIALWFFDGVNQPVRDSGGDACAGHDNKGEFDAKDHVGRRTRVDA